MRSASVQTEGLELNSAARPQSETGFLFFFTFLRMKTFASVTDCALQKATITVSLPVHMVTTLRHCCSVTLLNLSCSPLHSFPITDYPALQLIGGRSLSQLSDGEGGRVGGCTLDKSPLYCGGQPLPALSPGCD